MVFHMHLRIILSGLLRLIVSLFLWKTVLSGHQLLSFSSLNRINFTYSFAMSIATMKEIWMIYLYLKTMSRVKSCFYVLMEFLL